MGTPERRLNGGEVVALTEGSRWDAGRRGALLPALAGWLAARAAVATGVVVAHSLASQVEMPDGRLHLDQGLLTWDGTYYRVLAEGWYAGAATPEDATRFFPAYPALARVLDPLVPGSVDVALLLVANLCALAAAVVLWQLAHDVIDDERVARRAAWMVAVIPAANVFVFAYSEAAMLLVFTAALVALHRRRLGWLCALGVLAGLLRPAGVLLVVPVAVAAWQHHRERPPPTRRETLGWLAATGAPLAGLAGALGWIAVSAGVGWGEPFERQRQLRAGFHEPLSRVGEAVVDVLSGRQHDVYNLAFALGFAALFVVALRRRQPLPWLAFMVVTWVVAVGGTNMDSTGRYCMVAAPFTIALAQWAQHRWQQVAVGALGLAGTAWFTAEVMLGRIIP